MTIDQFLHFARNLLIILASVAFALVLMKSARTVGKETARLIIGICGVDAKAGGWHDGD